MNPDFDAYRLSDEHVALREAVRALAEKEIAPYAAEVDEQGRYPTEARAALVKAGFHAVTIPEEYGGEGADDPGFEVGPKERKLGINGSPTREIYFQDCTIPADRIIGAEGTGFKTALATLDHTRPTIGAQAVGIAQGALDVALAYVKERKQFGKAIADFQAVQFMLADMAMKLEAARLMVYTAAARAERGESNLGFISSASKCFASDVAMEVTTDAVQLFGGYGYTTDFPVERFMRDAKITQIYEGTNQIQRVVMSRALLK